MGKAPFALLQMFSIHLISSLKVNRSFVALDSAWSFKNILWSFKLFVDQTKLDKNKSTVKEVYILLQADVEPLGFMHNLFV